MGELNLCRNGRHTLFVEHRHLGRRGPDVDSTAATVIADAGVRNIRNVIVVHVVNHVDIDVVHLSVIRELPAAPIPAVVAAAYITESVINAAIKANVGTPEAPVPTIAAVIETPIRRGPERADIRSHHPDSGHPVIACRRCVAPGSRSPYIVVARAWGLSVFGQRRRRFRRLNNVLLA
jgi:hypothetical protein